jgi:hypothetical protein
MPRATGPPAPAWYVHQLYIIQFYMILYCNTYVYFNIRWIFQLTRLKYNPQYYLNMRLSSSIILCALYIASSKALSPLPLSSYARRALSAAAKKDIPSSVEGWKAALTPNQFEVLRRKATEPPGFSESKPGELEYELKRSLGTKYPKAGTRFLHKTFPLTGDSNLYFPPSRSIWVRRLWSYSLHCKV